MKKHLAKKTLAWGVFPILIALITGEVVARVQTSTRTPARVIPSANERLVYELNPQFPGINSFGMRGDEFELDDLNGTYVIAAIGDSHFYSLGVKKASEAIPQQLEQHLNSILGHEKVTVLSLGVPGYNMAQELEVLRAKALPFQPDLIILQYCINDTHVCNYIQPKHRRLNALIHKSELLVGLWKRLLYSHWGKRRLLERLGKRLPDALLFEEGLVGTLGANVEGEVEAHRLHPARTEDRVPPRYHYMLGRGNWEQRVHEFAAICRQATTPILATGLLEEEDRNVFAREGFEVYSFFDMIDRNEMEHYGYNPQRTSTHFNAEGSALIGKALASFVRGRYSGHIEAVQ